MGIGVNFICNKCHYDTGILMLNQGSSNRVNDIIKKYIYMYSHELDHKMLPARVEKYQAALSILTRNPHLDSTYQYYGCVCYKCRRTYEMLDILQQKEEEVFVGEKGKRAGIESIQDLFYFAKWDSLIGEKHSCLFCQDTVIKISEENLDRGLKCPKCYVGDLKLGDEFELWE